MANPMKLLSVNLTGKREFYVTQHYRELGNGAHEITGKQYDVTADVLPYLVKAQRDMAAIIRDKAATGYDSIELLAFIDAEITARTDSE